MYGIIYEARNKTNDKTYVGQTTGRLTEREAQHFSDAKSDTHNNYFYNALNKYKKADWEWKVLGYADCQFGLDTLEKSWIWIKESMAPNGYNTREGGSHGKHIKKTCKKISESKTGTKLTEEHCENISEGLKGNTNGCGNKDKKLSEERRTNISRALKGKFLGVKSSTAKTVVCVETSKAYGAIREAARETGINRAVISGVVNGNRKHKTAGGYHWRFVNEII